MDYVKLIYSADTAPSPFTPLSGDEIMKKLAVGDLPEYLRAPRETCA